MGDRFSARIESSGRPFWVAGTARAVWENTLSGDRGTARSIAETRGDRSGRFDNSPSPRRSAASAVLREVAVACGVNGAPSGLRMIASPLNPLYRLWKQVELFCRRLTSCALVGPLVCRSSEDVPTRFLATVVAVLLMHLHTGCRPGKYPFAPLSQVGADAATLAKVPQSFGSEQAKANWRDRRPPGDGNGRDRRNGKTAA